MRAVVVTGHLSSFVLHHGAQRAWSVRASDLSLSAAAADRGFGIDDAAVVAARAATSSARRESFMANRGSC